MAVPAGPTEQRYVGNGVTTIFTVPFLVIQASDLAVYIDGVKLTSGYTQSGVGNPTSTVTFSVAPANLSQILFNLEVPFKRLNDYQENGDFLARTVNNDFDRIWQALKQLLRLSGRALMLGTTDVDGQGWYRAKNNGIRDLRDPEQPQDAATMGWVDQFVAGLLGAITGPINNALNIFYKYPDNTSHVVQDLSSPTGADGVGYGSGSVGDVLDGLDGRFAAVSAEIDADIVAYNNGFVSPRGGNLSTSVKGALTTLGAVGRSGVYSTPSGFNTRFGPLWFRKDNSGNAYLISNLDKYKPKGAFATPDNYAALGVKAYFVSTSGSDAAAGTTWATALRTVAAASQKSDVDVIFVAGGPGANYFAAQHIGTYTGTRSISIQAIGGPVNFISGPQANTAPTWNATGIPGVYKQGNSDSLLTGVVALDYTDEAGNPLTLLPAADVNGVGAVAGSWFRSATELFISLPNFDVPTSNIYYYQSAPMRVTGGNKKFHHKGINYIGGNAGAFSVRGGDVNTVVFGEDIGCCGQLTGDGWQMKNMGISIAIRCRCSRNGNDGFNYHGPDGVDQVMPHFIEVDCIGATSRAAGTGNGSTSHELVRGIRIGTHCYNNAGPGFADVNDAQTYNVGCTSRNNGPNVNAYGFVVSADTATASGAVMFLDGCVSDGNAGDDFRSQNGAKLYYRDAWAGRDAISVDGTSTATPF